MKASPRVVVTAKSIEVYGFDRPLTEKGRAIGVYSCRTSSHEAVAWAIKRLAEELEKSTAYYRIGDPDKAGMIVDCG